MTHNKDDQRSAETLDAISLNLKTRVPGRGTRREIALTTLVETGGC